MKLKQFLIIEANDDDNLSTCAENIMKTVYVVSNLNKSFRRMIITWKVLTIAL